MSRTKTHSEIKASIKMLLSDQPVDSDKRLHVANFFSHRFLGERQQRQELIGSDPTLLLKKIRKGEMLNGEDKQQLSKMAKISSELD